jgi:hypothetical protein
MVWDGRAIFHAPHACKPWVIGTEQAAALQFDAGGTLETSTPSPSSAAAVAVAAAAAARQSQSNKSTHKSNGSTRENFRGYHDFALGERSIMHTALLSVLLRTTALV